MDSEILKQLQQAKTLGELLKIIQANFEVDTTQIAPITRGTIISGLQKAVKMTNCKRKAK